MEGKDVVVKARTGTGKTLAFVLPLLNVLPSEKGRGRLPRVLVLAPTRELAKQVRVGACRLIVTRPVMSFSACLEIA